MVQVDFDLSCVRCLGPLNGLSLSDRCFGCDLPVIDSLRRDLVDVDSGVITDDTSCLKCAYNLRGLPIGNACPECGEPVNIALRGNLFNAASQDWLLRVKRSVDWMYGATINVVVLVFFVGFANAGGYSVYLCAASAAEYAAIVVSLFFMTGTTYDSCVRRVSDKRGLLARVCVLLPLIWVMYVLFGGEPGSYFLVTFIGIPVGYALAFKQVEYLASASNNSANEKRAKDVVRRIRETVCLALACVVIGKLNVISVLPSQYAPEVISIILVVYFGITFLVGYAKAIITLVVVGQALKQTIECNHDSSDNLQSLL